MASGYTPIYRIFRDDVDVTGNFNDRGLAIEVEFANQDFGDQLRLSLDDRDWRIVAPAVGDWITVYLGYEEVGLSYMGRFSISEIVYSGPPRSLQISASSFPVAGDLTSPAIQSFEGMNLGGIIKHLGEKAGLAVEVHPALASVEVPFLNQIESASHVLGDLQRRFGGIFKIADGRLIAVPRDAGRSVGDAVVPVLQLSPEHFGQWEVRHNARTEYGQTSASYFDPVDNVRKWVSAGPAGSAFDGLVGGDGPAFQIGQLFASQGEAEAAAAAKMSALVRGSATFTTMLAQGDPWIRDGQRVLVSNMRDGVDGSWVVARGVHRFDGSALQTSLEMTVNGNGEDYTGDTFLDDVLRPLPGEIMGKLIVGTNGMIVGGI